MNILPSVGLTFKQVERIFFEIGCEVSRMLMQQFMEAEKKLVKLYERNELSGEKRAESGGHIRGMGKGFNDKIAALVSGKLSERLAERFGEVIRNTKPGIHEAVRKSVYPMHRGEIPFANSKATNGRKAIRRMFDLRPFSEMIYRVHFLYLKKNMASMTYMHKLHFSNGL
jgi:hypothetical protein